jgi:PilZ domain
VPHDFFKKRSMGETAVVSRSNRRITARKACLLTVRYRAEGDWRPATAMDLSPYGCRLRVGEDIPRGAQVAVVFEAPIQDGARTPSVEVPGTAMWARLEGLSFQVGVHFEDSPMGLLEILSVLS